jgi:hypothetical protein
MLVPSLTSIIITGIDILFLIMKHKKKTTPTTTAAKSFRKIIDLDSSNKHVNDSLFVLGTGTSIKGGEVMLIYVPKFDLSMELRIQISVLTC